MTNPRLLRRNQFPHTRRNFDYVASAITGGTVYSDETLDAASPYVGGFSHGGTTNDALYLGSISLFASFIILALTSATSGTRIAEYWNGSSWTTLTLIELRGSKILLNWFNAFAFVPPSNWAKTSVNNSLPMYFVRLKVTSNSQAVSIAQTYIDTIITSSEELDAPSSDVGQESPADSWESTHGVFVIENGKNDILDYNIGGGALLINLDPGIYRNGTELASAIQALFGSGFTCIYNNKTKKFTITKASGTFQLLLSSGANKVRSIGVTLGFDCGLDKTGALTYTSDFETTTTGGTIVIDSTNNILRLGAVNVTLSLAGTYSCKSACGIFKAQIDAAISGPDDFDVQWFESTRSFAFKRSGGPATWEWGHTITTCEALLGYSAIDENTLANAYTIADAARIHSEEWVVLVATSAKSIDLFHAPINNLTLAATAKLQKTTTGTWTDIETAIPISNKMLIQVVDPTESASIIRLLIKDVENPDGYVKVGYIGVGALADGYFEMTRTELLDTEHGFLINENQSRTSGGQTNTTLLSVARTRRFGFHRLTPEDYDELQMMIRELGTGGPVLYIPDADAPDISERVIWGRMTVIPSFPETGHPLELYDTQFFLEEFI